MQRHNKQVNYIHPGQLFFPRKYVIMSAIYKSQCYTSTFITFLVYRVYKPTENPVFSANEWKCMRGSYVIV